MWARIVWLGTLAYLLYNSVFFAFDVSFHQLLLVYVAVLSLWSLVVLLVSVDVDGLAARFSPDIPVRSIAVYMLVIAALFALVWLKDILPAVVGNTTSDGLEGTKMLTSPIEVLDLGVTLPQCTMGVVLLWRRHP